MTRRAAPENLQISEADELFYSWVGMTMSMAKDPHLPPDRREQLSETASTLYSGFQSDSAELLRAIAGMLGVRPRRDLFAEETDGFDFIAQLGIALSEGVSVRTRFDKGELPNVDLKTGIDGELQEWTAFAAGFWALLNTYLEEDPDADSSEAEGD